MGDMSEMAQGFFDEGKEYMETCMVLSIAENLRKANPIMSSKDLLDRIYQLLCHAPGISLHMIQEILSENGVIS